MATKPESNPKPPEPKGIGDHSIHQIFQTFAVLLGVIVLIIGSLSAPQAFKSIAGTIGAILLASEVTAIVGIAIKRSRNPTKGRSQKSIKGRLRKLWRDPIGILVIAMVATLVPTVAVARDSETAKPMSGPSAPSVSPGGTTAPTTGSNNDPAGMFGRETDTIAPNPQPVDRSLAISSPRPFDRIGTPVTGKASTEAVTGTVSLASGQRLWLVLYGTTSYVYYNMGEATLQVTPNGSWNHVIYVNPDETGRFELYAFVLDSANSVRLEQVFAAVQFVYQLPPTIFAAHIPVDCCKP